MISYRYHLISIIAVFLALAVGVVGGASALNNAVAGDLRHQVKDLKQANSAAVNQNNGYKAEAGGADLLAQNYGGKITAGSLKQGGVLVISLPGTTQSLRDSMAAQITTAGGTVAGQLQINPLFFDPTHGNEIQSLATSGSRPIGLQLPNSTDRGLIAGALIGYSVFGKGPASDLTQVVTGFSTLGMIKVLGSAPTPAKAVLVLTPGVPTAVTESSSMLLSFLTELATIGGPTVVAGNSASADSPGLIGLVRGNDTAKRAVSTVDDVDTIFGQLTVALVLADTLNGHKGQYGFAAKAESALPDSGR